MFVACQHACVLVWSVVYIHSDKLTSQISKVGRDLEQGGHKLRDTAGTGESTSLLDFSRTLRPVRDIYNAMKSSFLSAHQADSAKYV